MKVLQTLDEGHIRNNNTGKVRSLHSVKWAAEPRAFSSSLSIFLFSLVTTSFKGRPGFLGIRYTRGFKSVFWRQNWVFYGCKVYHGYEVYHVVPNFAISHEYVSEEKLWLQSVFLFRYIGRPLPPWPTLSFPCPRGHWDTLAQIGLWKDYSKPSLFT